MENDLCSFLMFFCIPLSCTALRQMPKKPGFHPPWQHSSPEGNTSKPSVLPLTEKSPCPLTHSPSTDEQLHHMRVSLQDEMEKPAAKATAATADFSHWFKKKKKEVKGKEGEKTNSLDSLICITEGLNQHYHRYSAYIDYWSGSGYLSLNTGVRQDISVFTASEFSDLIT